MVDVPKETSFRSNGRDKRYMYELLEFKEYSSFFPTPEDDVMGLDFLLAEPSCNDRLVEPFLKVNSENPQKYYVTEEKPGREKICAGTKAFDLTGRLEELQKEDNSKQMQGTDEGILQEMNNLPSICEDFIFDCNLGGEIPMLDCDTSNGLIINQPNVPISDDGKECHDMLELPIVKLTPDELPSHQNSDLIDKMTTEELLGAFKDIFGREALIADRLWLKNQILVGIEETDRSYSCSNFSDFVSASSGNCSNVMTEMVNKSYSPATGGEEGRISSAKLLTKKYERDFASHGKKPLLCGSKRTLSSVVDDGNLNWRAVVDDERDFASHGKKPLLCGSKRTLSSVVDDGNLNWRAVDACSSQKRSRKRPARYIDEYSKYQTIRTSKRFGSLSNNSQEKTAYIKSRHQDCKKEDVRGRKSICHDDYITEAIQVPFGPLLECSDKKESLPSDSDPAYCNTAIIKLSEEDTTADYESDDNDIGQVTRDKSRRKHNKYWSEYEITKLIEGVAEYGVGRWTEIKKGLFPPTSRRTSVDLKDKWRNLLKACRAQLQSKKEGKRVSHQQVSQSVLRQVKELSMMHPYPKISSPKNALLVKC